MIPFSTIIIITILFSLIELDKLVYKKLDNDYKRFIYKSENKESEDYYNTKQSIQLLKRSEKYNRTSFIAKVVGFIILLLLIYLYNKVDSSNSIIIINCIGLLIFALLIALGIYSFIKGIKEVNKYKMQFNKHNVKLEVLYITIRSSYFLIMVIGFFTVKDFL